MRFQLFRKLSPEEDPAVLPMSGIFEGSFEYKYQAGKRYKQNSIGVAKESNVELSFMGKEGEPNAFSVKGKGMNCLGLYKLRGTATKKTDGISYTVRLRKKYNFFQDFTK